MKSKSLSLRNHETAISLSLTLLTGLSMSACSMISGAFSKSGTENSATAGASGAAVAAFQSGFYAFAESNCAQCHGASQSPLFAISDVSQAYNNLIPYVNFSSPGTSTVVNYATNGHCGVSTCSNTANTMVVTNDITAWANAVAESGGGTTTAGGGGGSGSCPAGFVPTHAKYVLSPMPIPTNLPAATAATGTVIRWTISGANLNPPVPSVNGAIFEVQAQALGASTYKFINPRMVVPNSGETVTGVHVMIQATGYSPCEFAEGETWEAAPAGDDPNPDEINVTNVTNPVPNPPPTPLNSTILDARGAEAQVVNLGTDNLVIGFDAL